MLRIITWIIWDSENCKSRMPHSLSVANSPGMKIICKLSTINQSQIWNKESGIKFVLCGRKLATQKSWLIYKISKGRSGPVKSVVFTLFLPRNGGQKQRGWLGCFKWTFCSIVTNSGREIPPTAIGFRTRSKNISRNEDDKFPSRPATKIWLERTQRPLTIGNK